jgi:hypothetical protein
MSRFCLFALLMGGMIMLSGGLSGQDPKKDDPPAKIKGKLPGKYGMEIDKLKAKIAELESTRDKEMKAVLTDDQKKALETAILGGKDKDKDKDK